MKRLLLLCCLVLLFACQNSQSPSKASNKVFRYNQPSNITYLDPAFASAQANIWATHHLYNSLVELNEQLEVKPSLAKSWEVSEDGLSYTFTLREDVYFHDNECFEGGKGRKMNAQDVVFSLNRIISPDVNSPGSWIFKDKVADSNPFVAKDESTFLLTMKKPFPPMLGLLSMQYCSVVPKEAVEKYGDTFRENPVGTGPFRFKNWIEGQNLFLAKNENYFEKDQNGKSLPYLDAIKISFVGDRKTAFLDFKKGNLDYMSGLEASFINEILTPEGTLQPALNEQFIFLKNPYLNTEYLGINTQYSDPNHPLMNPQIRKALNYAINRKEMIAKFRNNVGIAAEAGFIPKGLPSYNPDIVKGFTYDPEKAKKILADAGHPNGENLGDITLFTQKDYVDLCTYLAKQWETIGVKVKIEVKQPDALREGIKNGTIPFFRASWIADYPDGENYLACFYGGNPAPPNYTRFSNNDFDARYDKILVEPSDETRFQTYSEMENIMLNVAPIIPLMYDQTAVFTQKNISGISENAVNLLDLKRVKKID